MLRRLEHFLINLKVFGQAFFKRLAGQGRSPVADEPSAKTPYVVRLERGKFKNSPADCF